MVAMLHAYSTRTMPDRTAILLYCWSKDATAIQERERREPVARRWALYLGGGHDVYWLWSTVVEHTKTLSRTGWRVIFDTHFIIRGAVCPTRPQATTKFWIRS